jgi:hypothetical protein
LDWVETLNATLEMNASNGEFAKVQKSLRDGPFRSSRALAGQSAFRE